MDKFCFECKYYNEVLLDIYKCTHEKNVIKSPISGQLTFVFSLAENRLPDNAGFNYTENCGEEGKWFEERTDKVK